MGAEAIVKRKLSHEEYIQLEEQEGIRYEYYDGEVVAMAGVSLNHNRITSNINKEFLSFLDSSICEVFQEGVKLEYGLENNYLYPDIMITCNPEDIQSEYAVRNPMLIVEVLSPSTVERDKDEKLAIYCTIPSLRYYLLVNQSKPYIEMYSRQKSLAVFQYQFFKSIEDVLSFPELNLTLSLNSFYQNVRFTSTH